MSTFLINIIAKSNLAEVLALDDAALKSNTVALSENSNALKGNSLASGTTGESSKKKAKKAKEEAVAVESLTMKIKENIKQLFGLGSAQDKVGYNFMGFSFRIGAWFVPTMALMLTSILPVIVALLAMASAAILAGGALVGVLALGALMQMRNQGRGGYAGARRPFESSDNGYARLSTIFEPVWKVLESPKLKAQMDNAKWFFQSTIGAFAEGLSNMLTGIDPGMLKNLENMFLSWLPRGMGQFAKWGSSMVKLIGSGTITRLGNLIDWIARGLTNAAIWLNSAGGWTDIDRVTKLIADICSVLMDMGKNALPVLSTALAQVWPMPLKPMLEAVSNVFKAIGSSRVINETFSGMVQIIVIFAVAMGILAVIAAMLVSTPALILGIIVMLYLMFKICELGVSEFVMKVMSLGSYLMAQVEIMFAKLINSLPFMGNDRLTKEIEAEEKLWDWDEALKGAYAPDWTKGWYLDEAIQGDHTARAAEIRHAIDVTFHGDDQHIDKVIVDGISEKTGTLKTPSSNMKSQHMVRL